MYHPVFIRSSYHCILIFIGHCHSLPGRSLGSQIFPFCATGRFRIIISPYHHFITYHHVFILLYLHIHRKSSQLTRAFAWKANLRFLCCSQILDHHLVIMSPNHHVFISSCRHFIISSYHHGIVGHNLVLGRSSLFVLLADTFRIIISFRAFLNLKRNLWDIPSKFILTCLIIMLPPLPASVSDCPTRDGQKKLNTISHNVIFRIV